MIRTVEEFPETSYLEWYPDVAVAVESGQFASGLDHYLRHGRDEGRLPRTPPENSVASSTLKPGDLYRLAIKVDQDWLTWIEIPVATVGVMAWLKIEYLLRDSNSGLVLVRKTHSQWACDESLQLRFPPVENSGGRDLELEIQILAVECPDPVHFWIEEHPKSGGRVTAERGLASEALIWAVRFAPPDASGPSGITFSPLTHCVHNCRHCLSRSLRTEPKLVSDEIARELSDHFATGGGRVWQVDYATEFFYAARLRPDLLSLVFDDRSKIMVNTNGQHLSEAMIERILRVDVLKIGFSCDGATEETYAKIRTGCGRLATVLDAARTTRRLRGAACLPSIGLSMVVMQSNVREISELVEIAARLGLDAVWLNQLWVVSDELESESLAGTPQLWEDCLCTAREVAARNGVMVETGPGLDPLHPQTENMWCQEPWNSCLVLGNGDVLACASPVSRIGNLNQTDLGSIWNGEDYRKLRMRVNSDRPPLMCQRCPVFRKPGNLESLFINRLPEGYDLAKDLHTPKDSL